MSRIRKGREEIAGRREEVICDVLKMTSDLRYLIAARAYAISYDDRVRLRRIADDLADFALHLEEDAEKAKKRIR